jgi:hydrogenase expression/formation protein HypE
MNKTITLNHGSGGRQSHDLISSIFARRFGMSQPLTDSAVLKIHGSVLAFTTDSYVIDPLFFPGGNIGKLAVCGTVNDLSVSGAIPLYISSAFILEEGFPVNDLEKIVESMAEEAEKAGVRIVTGDTKVVGKGKCDKLFINTSGTGVIRKEHAHISTGEKIKPGDRIIVNGSLGNHAIAVLGARNNLNFTSPVESDCASLNKMIRAILDSGANVHFMRDLTRGGLASVLHELSHISHSGIVIEEDAVPVEDPVRGLCEVLGFDPFYLANEGKIIIVADENDSQKIINLIRYKFPDENPSVIGEITGDDGNELVLNTSGGGRRLIDLPSGIQLPRIC